MKYFYDTEFLEGTQKKWFKQSEPTIDLISIGIVAEDGREYYAVSKDFNLKEAWNRWEGEYHELSNFEKSHGFPPRKKYWIRENVLKPIFNDLLFRGWLDVNIDKGKFTYRNLKFLINKYGKANKQISEEIIDFCAAKKNIFETDGLGQSVEARLEDNPIKLYGYYSAYDHVVLCWLFGKMIDLPKGFPMYTRDLKQSFDEKQAEWINKTERQRTKIALKNKDFSVEIDLKKSSNYPKQDNEHNALNDAKWNKELYEFLETIN